MYAYETSIKKKNENKEKYLQYYKYLLSKY